MIKTFADRRTQELYTTGKAKRFPADIAKRATRKLEYLNLAVRLDDLKVPPGNRLHAPGATEKASTRLPSTISGASVFGSLRATLTTLRYVTITDMRCRI